MMRERSTFINIRRLWNDRWRPTPNAASVGWPIEIAGCEMQPRGEGAALESGRRDPGAQPSQESTRNPLLSTIDFEDFSVAVIQYCNAIIS